MNLRVIVFACAFTFVFAPPSIAQQNWLWDNGGNGNDEAFANAIDGNGNIYTTGYFSLSAKFDTLVFKAKGSGDLFISKQRSNGSYEWTVVAGGTLSDRGYGISADPFGNVFVTGFYSGTATFGSYTLNSVAGSIDIFVAKVDGAGNFIWVKSFGGSDIDLGLDIHADYLGNVIVTGQFRSTAQFGGFSFSSRDDTTGVPSYDLFIMKLDAAGNVTWAKQGGSKFDDRGLSVATDAAGYIYVTGQYSDTLDLDAVYPNVGRSIGLLVKLNPAGQVQWLYKMLATQVLAYNVECYSNDVYVGGDFRGKLTINAKNTVSAIKPYPYEIFAARLDSTGTVKWITCDGSDNPVTAQGMAVDASGNPYLSGTFNCTMTEYASLYGTGVFNSVGFRDVFISKYRGDSGERLYERQFAGPGDEFCAAISVSVEDFPVIAGSFEHNFNIPSGNKFTANHTNSPAVFGPDQPSSYCIDNRYNSYGRVLSDGNKDIFSSSPIDTTRQPYDYFDRLDTAGCVRDSLLPFINHDEDTLAACDQIFLYANRRTGPDGARGPQYDYQWSTGAISDGITVTATGWYYLEMKNKDNCRKYPTDSVYAIVYPSPPDPDIATTIGNIRAALSDTACNENHLTLIVVFPDTAALYVSNAPPGYQIEWETPYGTVSHDTVQTLSGGIYSVTIRTPLGNCTRSNCVQVIIYGPGPGQCLLPNGFKPEIHFANPAFDATDTVEVCYDDFFTMFLVDSTQLAQGDSLLYLFTYANWSISGGFIFKPWWSYSTTFIKHYQSFQAKTTGPCSVTVQVEDPVLGGTLITVVRNFYLIVNPKPPLLGEWHGPPFMCPGDSILLSVTGGTIYDIYPDNGIAWQSAKEDSIIVTHPGTYICEYTVIDSVTGCTDKDIIYFTLNTKPAPQINAIPSNAIICPDDSVLLMAEDGTNYTWTGPLGNVISNAQSIYVSAPGYYHYDFVDTAGCGLVSEFIEVKTYSTPYLTADPQTICNGQSATLSVEADPGTVVQWLPPLSGGSLTQVVTTGGTYSCIITSCGITITESVVVSVITPAVHINVIGDSVICPGDTVVLSATSGMTIYDWQPGGGGSEVFYATGGATYTLTATDLYGCAVTATATVDTFPRPSAPVVAEAVICSGTTATLTAVGSGTITWYDSPDGAVIYTGSSFTTPVLFATTTYYVNANDARCYSVNSAVTASINPASLAPPIYGDSVICSYDTLQLATIAIGGGVYEWSGPGGFTSSDSVISIYPVDSANSGYYSIHLSDPQCSGPPDSIYVRIAPPPVVEITAAYSSICAGLGDTLRALQPFESYLWLPSGATDSVFVADSSGTYWLIAMDESGCTDTSSTLALNVIANPPSPQINDTAVCYGASIILSNVSDYSTTWYGTAFTYLDTGSTFITPVLMDSAVYYIQHTDTNGCRSMTDTVTVHVTPLPPEPILLGDTAYCEGSAISLTATSVVDTVYHWSGPDGLYAANIGIYIANSTGANAGTYSFYVTANGCTDSASMNVTVVPAPPVPLLTGDTAYCEGAVIIVNASNVSDTMNGWTGPGGFSSDSLTVVIPNAAEGNTGTYTFTVAAANCSTSASINVTVYPVPPVPIIDGDTVYCEGDAIILTTTNVADSTYSWTGPNGFAGSGRDLSVSSSTVNESGTYIFIVSNGGCADSASIQIAVYPVPANPIYGNGPICAGGTLAFSTDSIAGLLYSWSGPLGYTSNTFANTISNSYVGQSGYYTLQVSTPYCSSGLDSIYLEVVPFPVINLGNDTVVCPGMSLTLVVDSGYDAYSWSTGDNGVSVLVTSGGLYYVTVTNDPDCISSDSITVSLIDCHPEFSNVITPNNDGKNDEFYARYQGANILSMVIYNRWGTIVRHLNAAAINWDGKDDNGKEVSGGTYYYIIEAINYFEKREAFHGFIEVIR